MLTRKRRFAVAVMVVPAAAAVLAALIRAAYAVLLRDADGIDMLALAWYSGIVSFAIGIPAAYLTLVLVGLTSYSVTRMTYPRRTRVTVSAAAIWGAVVSSAVWMWYTGDAFHWISAASGFLAGWTGAVMFFAFVRDETKPEG